MAFNASNALSHLGVISSLLRCGNVVSVPEVTASEKLCSVIHGIMTKSPKRTGERIL
jgi:hypothetical protein